MDALISLAPHTGPIENFVSNAILLSKGKQTKRRSVALGGYDGLPASSYTKHSKMPSVELHTIVLSS